MNKFETACGHSFEHENDGQFHQVLIQRTYDESSGNENFVMAECSGCNQKKVVVPRRFININRDTWKTYGGKDTYCLAKNLNFQESQLVDYYDSEVPSTQTIEVIFQKEEWRKVITKTIKTKRYSMMDAIEGIVEALWEEISEENDYDWAELKMTSMDGDYGSINIESEDELKGMVVSCRVIGYELIEE